MEPHFKDDFEKLDELIGKGDEVIKKIPKENSILLVGRSGAGKTTALLILADEPLVAQKDNCDQWNFIPETKEYLRFVSTERTFFPNFIKSKNRENIIIDFPGMNDISGVIQDIANGYYLQSFLKLAGKVIFIFVVADGSFANRGVHVMEDLKQFVQLFNEDTDFSQLENSVSLLVTQVSGKTDSDLIKNKFENAVKHSLKGRCAHQEKLEKRCEKMAEYLMRSVIVIPTPKTEEDGMKFDYPKNLLHLIEKKNQYCSISSENLNVSIAENLKPLAKIYFEQSKNVLKTEIEVITKILIEEAGNIINLNNNMTEALNQTIDSSVKLKSLQEICALGRIVQNLVQENSQYSLERLVTEILKIFEILKNRPLKNKTVEELESTKDMILQKKRYVGYFELVCKEVLDLKNLFDIFSVAASELIKATEKGLDLIDIQPNMGEDFYLGVKKLLTEYDENPRRKNLNLSICDLALGNLYKEKKDIDCAMKEFISAKELNPSYDKIGDIFRSFTDIFHYDEKKLEPLFSDVIFLDKMFERNKQEFEETVLSKVEYIIKDLLSGKKEFFKNYSKSKKHMIDLNICKDLENLIKSFGIIVTLEISNNTGEFKNNLDAILQTLKTDFIEEKKKEITNLEKNLKNILKCLEFFNEKMEKSNKKLDTINEWSKRFEPLLEESNSNMIKRIENLEVDESREQDDYFEKIIYFSKMVTNSLKSLRNISKASYLRGKNIKSNKDKAFEYFKEALDFDISNRDARMEISKIYSEKGNFFEAAENYGLIGEVEKAIECYQKAINTYKSFESYYKMIEFCLKWGLIEKAHFIFYEAKLNFTNKEDVKRLVQLMLTAEQKRKKLKENMEKYLKDQYDFYPCLEPINEPLFVSSDSSISTKEKLEPDSCTNETLESDIYCAADIEIYEVIAWYSGLGQTDQLEEISDFQNTFSFLSGLRENFKVRTKIQQQTILNFKVEFFLNASEKLKKKARFSICDSDKIYFPSCLPENLINCLLECLDKYFININ